MSNNIALHEQLSSLRPQLLRFTRQRIHDETVAEDVVQESLLAVLEAPERFAGKSSLSTYVIGILKFKIIDNFRRARHAQHINSDSSLYSNHYSSHYVNHDIEISPPNSAERYGITHSSLCEEFNPLSALEQKSFFKHLEIALKQLPEKSAQAFTLVDCLEIDAEEICTELGINKNNLMVTVHRARHALRKASALQHFLPTPAIH